MLKFLICVCILLILPSQSLITKRGRLIQSSIPYVKDNMMMKRGGITLSVASGDSPTDSGNKLVISNIILSLISVTTLCLTIKLTSDLGSMKTDFDTNFNTVQNEISTVQNEISTVQNDITGLSTKFSALKADTSTSNLLSDLKYRFDAFGIGSAVSLGVFAGSGNIVKVLEYFDKKAENDKLK